MTVQISVPQGEWCLAKVKNVTVRKAARKGLTLQESCASQAGGFWALTGDDDHQVQVHGEFLGSVIG